MDKWDVVRKLQSVSQEVSDYTNYLCAVWNTGDDRTFEEWQANNGIEDLWAE